jgi:Family of unknown function (DUF6092)
LNNYSADSIEGFLFEYSIFLVTAARGTLDEPHSYGALRLIDGITRLTELYSKTSAVKPDRFLLDIRREIQVKLDSVMQSEEAFTAFIEQLIVKFTDEMERRYGGKS